MSIRALKKWALLLTFWVALQTRCLRADQTITGNLTVTGTTDIQGDTLTFGTRTDNSDAGLQTLYTDGTTSTLEFDASRSANIWKWQQNGSTTLQLQMSLSSGNALVLYNQASTPVAEITLNPLGTSSFAGSLTIGGTDNEMANQTLVNSHSVLTEGLADSRYASSSSVSPLTSDITIGSGTWGSSTVPNMSLNGGTAYGPGSFAEGFHSSASGNGATAMGFYSSASGSGATALGISTATGNGSTASGYSTASGRASTAMGFETTASGDFSTAMGISSTASGLDSTAMGRYSTASGWYSTAMGRYSTASGRGSMAAGTDSTASGGGSTAFGVYSTASGGGSTAFGGRTTASGWYSTVSGKYSTASGNYSMAFGMFATASGLDSTAMGRYSTASGALSTASGYITTAQAYDSFVIGTCNVGLNADGGTASATTWVPTDPLFEVGNGTASSYYYYPTTSSGYYQQQGPLGYVPPGVTSDALVVYKNGNTTVQGTVTAPTFVTTAPAGDIPMYTGN